MKDELNDIKCEIKYGKVKKRPSDYIAGSITQKGKSVSKFDGTYCGFMNFDDIRFWDGRYMKGFKINLEEKPL